MTTDLVSIVMPMYNAASYVGEAVESVLRQDYPHFELIVVDDGSTDGGHKVVEEFASPRIRLIRTENRGISAARNLGIDESRGAYVTFLDSDDLFTRKALSSRLTALLQSGTEVAFSKNTVTVSMTSESTSIDAGTEEYAGSSPKLWDGRELNSEFVDGRFFVFSQSFLMNRKFLQGIGKFDPEIKIFEDVEFISRLLPAAKGLVETFAPFYIYRRRHDSFSVINSRRKATDALHTLRQVHRNLAQYLLGREDRIAQNLFSYCVQAYPYWTHEHRDAMAEARRLRGETPFDLSSIGGPKSQAIARVLGWRAGRFANFASNYFKFSATTRALKSFLAPPPVAPKGVVVRGQHPDRRAADRWVSTDLVSIVMPMHNTARYVGEAIESVLRQDYPHFELIVVDDGSTDGGHQVIERYPDPRIRLIRTENRGLSAARNLGIDESRGAYVTFLDSDDLLTPGSLSSRLTALLQSGVAIAFSQNTVTVGMTFERAPIDVDAENNATPAPKLWEGRDLISMLVNGKFFVFSQSFLMDRKLLKSVGGFDPQIRIYVDVEFISRLLPAAKGLVETFAPFYIYRRRHDSLSVINSRRKAAYSLRTVRQVHRNLAQYLVGREDRIAQNLFSYCVQAYPYWTHEHRDAMAEARRLRGELAFELSAVGGPRAQAIARILGWRAGRLANFSMNYLKHQVLARLLA